MLHAIDLRLEKSEAVEMSGVRNSSPDSAHFYWISSVLLNDW
jgi:hypothetical protein